MWTRTPLSQNCLRQSPGAGGHRYPSFLSPSPSTLLLLLPLSPTPDLVTALRYTETRYSTIQLRPYPHNPQQPPSEHCSILKEASSLMPRWSESALQRVHVISLLFWNRQRTSFLTAYHSVECAKFTEYYYYSWFQPHFIDLRDGKASMLW